MAVGLQSLLLLMVGLETFQPFVLGLLSFQVFYLIFHSLTLLILLLEPLVKPVLGMLSEETPQTVGLENLLLVAAAPLSFQRQLYFS